LGGPIGGSAILPFCACGTRLSVKGLSSSLTGRDSLAGSRSREMERAVESDQSNMAPHLIVFSDQIGRKAGGAHITDHAPAT
jgi:hypothetical protein